MSHDNEKHGHQTDGDEKPNEGQKPDQAKPAGDDMPAGVGKQDEPKGDANAK